MENQTEKPVVADTDSFVASASVVDMDSSAAYSLAADKDSYQVVAFGMGSFAGTDSCQVVDMDSSVVGNDPAVVYIRLAVRRTTVLVNLGSYY